MRKRILSLLLAAMLVCALLPFGAMAADLSVYDSVIPERARTSGGILKDLDGDGVEELYMVIEEAGVPHGLLYTIAGGAPKQLLDYAFNGPDIAETNELAQLQLIANGSRALVVTTEEENIGADDPSYYWNDGVLTFYQLSNGALKKGDVMRYHLYMRDGTDKFLVDYSYISYNEKVISGEEMNQVFARVDQNTLELYPLQQVYNATQGFFQDVAEDQYYADPVSWALENGITKGATNVDFAPNASCTRGQVVTFLWRAAGEPKPTSTKNPFSDVKASDYFYNAVLWAVEKGITNGTSATTFAPGASCTRGQVVTFLWRFDGGEKMSGSNPFSDVKTGDYFYDAVLWAVDQKVTNGTTATTFGPGSTCTRGQIVTFLYRAV